ncbi:MULTISPECIES: DUF3325 family protein [Shewanella]|uniref:DUF3325 domain-containing protein n=1 Tax=Shewanella japonica TaxID=93973 RepID=A0ABN4YQD7_9GAMM|nr:MULTISPECIES: DUF3325 family protein [Shewanella]ARD23929.1 hypothetical protein SJ2017_3686 [Shewanella japonica]
MLSYFVISTCLGYIAFALLAQAMNVPRRKNWHYSQNVQHRTLKRVLAFVFLALSVFPLVQVFGVSEGITLFFININLLAFAIVIMVTYYPAMLNRQCLVAGVVCLVTGSFTSGLTV